MEAGTPLAIDGSHGEGGGQLLRTAVALAVLCQRPLRVFNIRAARPRPGLAAQHLTAVRALAEVCAARVEGLAPGSREILFQPGTVRPGRYRFDVGTAGSIALVLQALLPVAVASQAPFSFHLTGGTDVEHAPPLDYLAQVLLPLLARMGARVDLRLLRRGYYPRGGGAVQVDIAPGGPLRALVLDRPGALRAVEVHAHTARLPDHVAQRMAEAARQVLAAQLAAPVTVLTTRWPPETALGSGGAIVLVADCEHTRLGASALARRGVPAEALGEAAAGALLAELAAGATLDVHAADQLPVYMALAQGTSRFQARHLSRHAETALWLLRQFIPLRVEVEPQPAGVAVSLAPPWNL